MSAHLMIVAGYMDLPPSHKLTLMKLCDSADDRTRIAYPGLDAVRLWAGTKKSRSLEVLKDLQEWGLVMQVSAGHRGRRAEFKVFPQPGDEVFSLAVKQKKPCPGVDRFAGSPGIPTDVEVAARIGGEDTSASGVRGSTAPAPKGPADRTLLEGSGVADPSPERVRSSTGKGPIQTPNGSDLPDPFGTYLPSSTYENLPPADAADDEALFGAPTTQSDVPQQPTAPDAEQQPTFDDFWAAYPNRQSKADARKAWDKLVSSGQDMRPVVEGALRVANDPNLPDRKSPDWTYVKYPQGWLTGRRWEDENGLPARRQTGPRFTGETTEADALDWARAIHASEPAATAPRRTW